MRHAALSPSPALARAYEECRVSTRHHARSFYFASHLLPPVRRAAAYALYAFCRAADDSVDEDRGASPQELQDRLGQLRARLDRVYEQQAIVDGPDLALADVVGRFGVARAAFDELLTGLQSDLEPVALQTTQELLRYCHQVAGVVGELLLPVLGAESTEARARADDLGVAMQLTNILRDVGEDLGRDRIYLPAEELAAFGLTHRDLRRRVLDERWSELMRAQILRARWYYERADLGVPLIRTWSGRLTTRAMRLVYGDILRAIEANRYDVFARRAQVSSARKLVLLSFALVAARPPSARPPVPPPLLDGPLSPPMFDSHSIPRLSRATARLLRSGAGNPS